MPTDSVCRHRRSSRPAIWQGFALILLSLVFAAAVPAQDEVLQYAGGERDIEPLTVVTDTTISSQLVRDLAGSFVEVESVAEVGESPIGLALDEADRQAIAAADLVVYQGLGLMPAFIAAAEQRDADDRVMLTERIPEFRLLEGGDGETNPHTYLSPALQQFAVDYLTTRLKKRLDAVAGEIEGNRLRVNIELQSLKRETEGLMEDVPRGERVLVTDNDVFAYFAKAYYFQLLDVTQGEGSGEAVEQINRNGTPNVFQVAGVGDGAIEEWLDAHRGDEIPESVGLANELIGLWLGKGNLPTATYIGLFRQNVSRILLGLKPLPAAGQEAPELAQ